MDLLRSCLVELAVQVARRLRRHGLRGRAVELKVRFADFQTITRSKTLGEAIDITQGMLAAGVELLTKKLRLAIRRCVCSDSKFTNLTAPARCNGS